MKNCCVEYPVYEKEWLGISFDKLSVKPSFYDLATSEFYDAFYEKFLDKYSGFMDLPGDWLAAKRITAEYISGLLPDGAKVLSYGCGSGYVESLIASNRSDLRLTAFDFAEVASKFIENDSSVNIIKELDPKYKFNVIYINHVLYAIDFQGCIEFLSKIRNDFLEDGGTLIIVNHSNIPYENGIKLNFYGKLKLIVKSILKPYYKKAKFFISKRGFQFWGWERNNACYLEILRKSNFDFMEVKGFNQHSYLIVKKG